MKTKSFFLIAAFVGLVRTTALAQQYMVYSTIGSVSEMKNGKATALQPRKLISASDQITIGKESALTVLDENKNTLHCFTAAGKYTVTQLLSMKGSSKKDLSKQYMNYLVKRLFASGSQKMTHPDSYMQATATAYRSTATDSLLLGKLAAMLQKQNLQNMNAEKALTQSSTFMDSDLDVAFELVDCETGMPLGKNVRPNTSCYVRVSNRTNELLYMNVLDIDTHGEKYLVLPVDSAVTCSHLMVPPMSTVSFKSEPLLFGEEPSAESFILIATEEPVDFSILMSPIRYSGKESIRAGLHRCFHQVRKEM